LQSLPTTLARDVHTSDNSEDNGKWSAHIEIDSLKPCLESNSKGDSEEEDMGKDEDDLNEDSDKRYNNDGLHVQLMTPAVEMRDDTRDEDWVPIDLQRKHAKRLAQGEFHEKTLRRKLVLYTFPVRPRPKEYAKGPDMANKAPRTRSLHADSIRRQQNLDIFGFKWMKRPSAKTPDDAGTHEVDIDRSEPIIDLGFEVPNTT
jgi:hypothetical protein